MKRTFIAAAAIAAAFAVTVAAPSARAQDWPTKPVHILIGFGAGGGTDVATRILADGLSEALGQQFIVENRPGAGGTIAGGARRTLIPPFSNDAVIYLRSNDK